MFKKLSNYPFLFFLPFAFYYAYLIVAHRWTGMRGDETRYINFADHLMHGYYSAPAPYVNLWNGPGYPITLLPFAILHIGPLYQALTNVLYLYLAVVFLYKVLRIVGNKKIALILSVLLAVYPSALAMLPMVYTETITTMLISLSAYTSVLFFVRKKQSYGLVSGLLIGFLVLVKIIFGYVIIICAAIFLTAWLIKKRNAEYLRAVNVLLIAFAVTVPYLIYTWHLTARFLYWGNSGGMSLYWMSTPYNGEYGDWKMPDLSNTQYPTGYKSAEANALLKKNHIKDITFIEKHKDYVEQDDLYKQLAISNIKQHPWKFLSNYLNNLSRMLFNFPYSYATQDASIVRSIIVGSSILWLTLISLVVTVVNWRSISFALKFVLLITAIYLLLSGMLSAYPRQLDVVIPVFLFWFGYLGSRVKTINLKFKGDDIDDIDLIALADDRLQTDDELIKINDL